MSEDALSDLVRQAERLPFRVEVILRPGAPAADGGRFVEVRQLDAAAATGRAGWLRAAVMLATGDLMLFTGSDGSVPLGEVLEFVPRFERGAQVVIGSRYLGPAGMTRCPWHRRLGHALVNYAVRVVMLRGVRDSRCGFKCFSAPAARHLFCLVGDESPAPQLEALGLAQRFGYNIVEVPVRWQSPRRGALVRIGRAIAFLAALLLVRCRVMGQGHRRPVEGTA